VTGSCITKQLQVHVHHCAGVLVTMIVYACTGEDAVHQWTANGHQAERALSSVSQL